jgi:hypothetical protein
MDEQLEQVIKQLESWSENQSEISMGVEIGFFIITLEGGLAAFEDKFFFKNQFCGFLFQPSRCSFAHSVWQEIGSQGYWLVRLGHPFGLITLYETRVPITPHEWGV